MFSYRYYEFKHSISFCILYLVSCILIVQNVTQNTCTLHNRDLITFRGGLPISRVDKCDGVRRPHVPWQSYIVLGESVLGTLLKDSLYLTINHCL